MPVSHVKATPQVCQLMGEIKEKHHPHLEQALIALSFVDSKPFVKDRINLGRVGRFSPAVKLWFPNDAKYDFHITVCADVWFGLLNDQQRESYLDLVLTRCKVEYEANTVLINGKKQVVKDDFGRIEYTNQVKTDDEGQPVWKVVPLDLAVITENLKRYGIWYDDLLELKKAIESHEQ